LCFLFLFKVNGLPIINPLTKTPNPMWSFLTVWDMFVKEYGREPSEEELDAYSELLDE